MSKETILKEFDEKFQEFMENGVEPSPKGTQRVWATAYPMRENIKQFLIKAIDQTREETIREVEEILSYDFSDNTYEEMFKITFKSLKELLNKLKK